MVSAFKNPNQPPLMSPESQKPGLFALGKANFMEGMKDPRKAAILQSMLMQSLSQIGGGMMGGGQRMSPRPAFNPMDFATLMQRPQAPPPMPTQAAPAQPTPVHPAMPPKDPAKSPLAQFRNSGPRYYQAI